MQTYLIIPTLSQRIFKTVPPSYTDNSQKYLISKVTLSIEKVFFSFHSNKKNHVLFTIRILLPSEKFVSNIQIKI